MVKMSPLSSFKSANVFFIESLYCAHCFPSAHVVITDMGFRILGCIRFHYS